VHVTVNTSKTQLQLPTVPELRARTQAVARSHYKRLVTGVSVDTATQFYLKREWTEGFIQRVVRVAKGEADALIFKVHGHRAAGKSTMIDRVLYVVLILVCSSRKCARLKTFSVFHVPYK
jgi:hypothetical protein